MTDLANRVGCTVSGTPGTGPVTLGAAISGYQTAAAAYGANATVTVVYEDGTAWGVETGCAYDFATNTLARGVHESSSTGSALSLTSAAKVFVTLSAAELAGLVSSQTHAATLKPIPVDADEVGLIDSAASFGLKRLTWAALKTALNVRSSNNDIGVPGQAGFGVGICPAIPPGYTELAGATVPAHNNYGNYQYTDGSVMVWVPAFYFRIGSASNPTYATYGVNSIHVRPIGYYTNDAAAEADGFYRHRAFINAGANQSGVFVDKYQPSNNGGVASSIKLGMPLVSAAVTGNSPFGGLTGAPANAYYGAIAAAKTRGSKFHPTSIFVYDALARLAQAHAQAATSATWCAWYDASGVKNFPKGNNNGALNDVDDNAVTYTAAGASGTPVLAQSGSGVPFAKTTHNGQPCGIADLNGNTWEIALGMTCVATSKAITGVTLANPLRLTIAGHGYTTGQTAMITSVGGTTQINDNLYKLSVVDANTISLDGCDGTGFGAYTSGGACTVGTFYALKNSVDIALVTDGNSSATDHWGATAVAAQFDVVAPNFATTHGSNGYNQKYGNAAAAVFAMGTVAERALSMLGMPAPGGLSAAGTNQFGADSFDQCIQNELCVLAGGYWGYWAHAGVRARFLRVPRGGASDKAGFRSASYL